MYQITMTVCSPLSVGTWKCVVILFGTGVFVLARNWYLYMIHAVSPMLNYSIDSRVCKAGMMSETAEVIFMLAVYSHQFCSSVVQELHHAHHLQDPHSHLLYEESNAHADTLLFVLRQPPD